MPAPPIVLAALRTGIFVAVLGCLSAPALAQQPPEDDPDKITNDSPTRPIQMPAATAEVREAFDDFDRFKRRGAWERATKALYSISDVQAGRFVDGANGFIIPVARKRHEVLTGLSPEGLAAYRLFYDSEAKKLLDNAEGKDEQPNLEKLFSTYFLTTVGDNATDRLGDLYFELGRFDHAADCYLAVLRERTDTDIPPALLAVKAALALAKAGRGAEGRALRAEVAERFAAEVVTIAGRKAKATEHLAALARDEAKPGQGAEPAQRAESAAGEPPTLGSPVPAAWQVRFAASVMAGMTPAEVVQWEANPLSLAVPRVAVEGDALYANYLGHVFAVELATGKLRWRSASFHNIDINAMSDQIRMVDSSRYAVVAAPGFVYSLGRDLKDMNYQAQALLVCRRADNGEVVWQSTNFADYADLELVGLPILARDTLLVAAKSSMMNNYGGQENMKHQFVLAIRPRDGKLLWRTDVGTFRSTQRYYYYGMPDSTPQPRMAFHNGSVYLDTHSGLLARINLESGRLEWGYGYKTEPIQSTYMGMFFWGMSQEPTPVGSPPIASGETLLVKGAKSDRLAVIDPGRMTVVWDRSISKSARPIGFDDGSVFLGGPDLEAVDRQSRRLRWSLPMPEGNQTGTVLVRPDGLWQFTPRGIFEVDPQAGRVRRIFRGDDPGALGGDLTLTDRWLLATSNQTISAYPRSGPDTGRADAARDAGASPSKAGGADE